VFIRKEGKLVQILGRELYRHKLKQMRRLAKAEAKRGTF